MFLKLDEERIAFLIELLYKSQYENKNDELIAKEIYTDLRIIELELELD